MTAWLLYTLKMEYTLKPKQALTLISSLINSPPAYD